MFKTRSDRLVWSEHLREAAAACRPSAVAGHGQLQGILDGHARAIGDQEWMNQIAFADTARNPKPWFQGHAGRGSCTVALEFVPESESDNITWHRQRPVTMALALHQDTDADRSRTSTAVNLT
jgi:hypothetical protein